MAFDPYPRIAMALAPDEFAPFQAASYRLLLSDIECWTCKARTPTAALWVPEGNEMDEDGEVIRYGAAMLQYIQGLDANVLTHVTGVAPWLRPARTHTSGISYLAHHCTTCDVVQGDHYLFNPDGPYWPQDDTAVARFGMESGSGPLRAVASVSESAWMERVGLTP